MPFRPLIALSFAVALLAGANLHAEALVKPVPLPDLAKLSQERADGLKRTRETFDTVLKTAVGDNLAQAQALIGSAYAGAGFYDAAAVAFDNAIELAPNDARWQYARGIVARGQSKDTAAQTYFERAFQLDTEYLPIRFAVVIGRMQAKDLDGARKLLNDYVARHNDQSVAYSTLGDIAYWQKRYPEAIEQYQRALALEPKATQLYGRLADAYTATGDAKSASEARAKAGGVAPTLSDPLGQPLLPNAAPLAAAGTPLEKATAETARLIQARQYGAARQSLDAALKLSPGDAGLMSVYARLEAAAGDLPAAKSRAAAAVAANPKYPTAHLGQAIALEMAGDDTGAERSYQEAIRLDPTLLDARIKLGNLQLRTGRPELAAGQFREAIKASPDDGDAWTRLVAAETLDGKCALALKDVNDGLAKAPQQLRLLQLFVRLASTCPAAHPEERRMALDYGLKFYKANDVPQVSEAFALSLAANGKWDDAVRTQEAAMFIQLRNGGARSLPAYRELLDLFKAHKVPERPWASSSPVYHPERLAPDPKPASAKKK